MARPLPAPFEATERLKDRIRACASMDDLSAAITAIAPEAKAHEPKDPGGIAQLRRLIEYQRMSIREGWTRKEDE